MVVRSPYRGGVRFGVTGVCADDGEMGLLPAFVPMRLTAMWCKFSDSGPYPFSGSVFLLLDLSASGSDALASPSLRDLDRLRASFRAMIHSPSLVFRLSAALFSAITLLGIFTASQEQGDVAGFFSDCD